MWEKVIFALDVDTEEDAMFFLREKPPALNQIKIGMRLFFALGEKVFSLVPADHKIFLDLKLHDIPSTIEKAMAHFARYPIWLMSVHCAGGEEMLKRAREAAGDEIGLLGVTLLTSLAPEEVRGIYGHEPAELVVHFAKLAEVHGLRGVVCSSLDVPLIKNATSSLLCVCPGIRLERAEDDQRRTATPKQALAQGADYLVIGRPLLQALRKGEVGLLEKHLSIS